jgi:protein TonB
MPDAPSVAAPAASSNVNLGNLMSTQAAPLPPAATPVAPPPAAPTAIAPPPEKKNLGGQIQQAVLLKRRDPEYPKLARESGASGVVEVIATIGTDGRVKSVQVVKGHPLLRQAAIDAVKSWTYRPTMLNGAPVEGQTQVLLNFKADR